MNRMKDKFRKNHHEKKSESCGVHNFKVQTLVYVLCEQMNDSSHNAGGFDCWIIRIDMIWVWSVFNKEKLFNV